MYDRDRKSFNIKVNERLHGTEKTRLAIKEWIEWIQEEYPEANIFVDLEM